MNFLGMGTMEILLILLIAFIFLGPDRMVNAARFLGKTVGQLRRMSDDLRDLATDAIDEEATGPSRGPARVGLGDRAGQAPGTGPSAPPASEDSDEPGRTNGPVAFQPARDSTPEADANADPDSDSNTTPTRNKG